MTDTQEKPIIVNKSVAPTQARATVRLLLGYGLAYAAGQGLISKELADIIGPQMPVIVDYAAQTLPVLGVFLWSQYATWRKSKTTVAIAEAAPDHIAQVK